MSLGKAISFLHGLWTIFGEALSRDAKERYNRIAMEDFSKLKDINFRKSTCYEEYWRKIPC